MGNVEAAQPLVSIIVPTFNYAPVIGEALDSLVAQSYPAWECLVIDDDSDDDTLDVLAEYAAKEPRIRFWHQQRTGPVTARNTLLASVRGEYIQFLDADDLLEPDKLRRHVTFLEERPDVGLVYGDVRYFSSDRSELRYSMLETDKDWMPRVSGTGRELLEHLVRFNIMSFNAALFRRSTIDEVGPFDDGDVAPLADWDYLFRCAARGHRFEYGDWPQTMTLMRWHPTSMSSDRRYMLRATLCFRRKLRTMLDDSELLRENARLHGNDLGELGTEEIAAGRTRGGMSHLLRAVWFSKGIRQKRAWAARLLLAPVVPATSFKRIARGSMRSQMRYALRRAFRLT